MTIAAGDTLPDVTMIRPDGSAVRPADYAGQKLLHIYVPDYYRRRMPFFKGKEWVMILAQPGLSVPLELDKLNGIELDAIEGTSLRGDFEIAGRVSAEKSIPLIKASDSVDLADIGKFYTELEWK